MFSRDGAVFFKGSRDQGPSGEVVGSTE